MRGLASSNALSSINVSRGLSERLPQNLIG